MAALNPRMTIGHAIEDALDIHHIGEKPKRKYEVMQMLDRVGLSPAETFYNKYPHQLSGGQRQKAVIGRAMILESKFIVADEPVAMVDVSIRAQILDLMLSLKKELGLTYVFITHDLATASYFCEQITIMYLGKIVEIGLRDEVFNSPKHPYTVALMSAIPVPDPKHKVRRLIPRGRFRARLIRPPVAAFTHDVLKFSRHALRKFQGCFRQAQLGKWLVISSTSRYVHTRSIAVWANNFTSDEHVRLNGSHPKGGPLLQFSHRSMAAKYSQTPMVRNLLGLV